MRRLALIEEDEDLALLVRQVLQREGYAISRFGRGREGLAAVKSGAFDLAVIDFALHDLDGLSVCRELRLDPQTKALPIVMLTPRAERDRLVAEPLGADDYLVKPPRVGDLVAHVAEVWRRRSAAPEPDVYEDAVLRVDSRAFRAFVGGAEVKLARKELELLWLLVRNAGSIVSRDRLRHEVWHLAGDVETRTIDAHVRSLRRKIGAERIATVVGEGYRYIAP